MTEGACGSPEERPNPSVGDQETPLVASILFSQPQCRIVGGAGV